MKKSKKIGLSLNKKVISKFQQLNRVIGGQTGRACDIETNIICPGPDTNGSCDSYASNCFSCGIC